MSLHFRHISGVARGGAEPASERRSFFVLFILCAFLTHLRKTCTIVVHDTAVSTKQCSGNLPSDPADSRGCLRAVRCGRRWRTTGYYRSRISQCSTRLIVKPLTDHIRTAMLSEEQQVTNT